MPNDSVAAPLLTDLDALFPASARSVLSHSRLTAAALLPTEAMLARTFNPGRLAEFRHGRSCARAALERLGVPPAPIPMGSNREPLWPDGLIGSISHAGETAAAVVGFASQLASLGLDLEAATELEKDLWQRICRPEELNQLRASARSPGLGVRLLFSAKEAAYKALWPMTRQFLEFHELDIRLDFGAHRFAVWSHRAGCVADIAAKMDGRFLVTGDLVATGVAIRR